MGCGVSQNNRSSSVVDQIDKTSEVSEDIWPQTLSTEEDQIQELDKDFQPNFAEFPSHVTLRHENVRYWEWKGKHPEAGPLHPGYPDPDIVRKRDMLQHTDFKAADDRALSAPKAYLSQHLDVLVNYLIKPFKDDLNKARVLFRWICAQDFNSCIDDSPFGSADYYLYQLKCGYLPYSHLYFQMCKRDNRMMGGFQTIQDKQQETRYKFKEFYFLTNPEEFIYSHFPEQEGWQLLARPVTKQEYQSMAYLQRGFFHMDLDCLQERKCTLHSQSQETLLTLGLPKECPKQFYYQLWKSSKEENWNFKQEEMTRFVFLEQQEGIVLIKVIYPVMGRYRLVLYVSDHLTNYCWSAEYLLICDKTKQGCSALPPNSRYEWGPGHDTQKLGMTPVTHPHGTIETDDGETEVVFNLSTQVDTLTKLRSDNQAEELLQQSLLHRTEDSKLFINTRLQAQGSYALDIYGKPKGEGGEPVLVCTYLVNTSSPVLEPFKFPKIDKQAAGPSEDYSKFKIVPVSHKTAYFTSKEGFENILFQYSSELSFMTELMVDYGEGMEKVENHTFIEQSDSAVIFQVRFPQAGIYNLKIYAKNQSDSGSYQTVYNYIIHVPVRMKDCSPFPEQYLRLGCKVDGLESGYLGEGENVRVEVVVPEAISVAAIMDGDSTEFSEGPNGHWAAVVNTGKAGSNIKLAAKFEESKSYESLFEYQIKGKQELDAMKRLQEEQFESEQKKQDEIEILRKKKAETFEILKTDLIAAVETEDITKLREAVTQVEKRFYTTKLREEYMKAKDLIRSVDIIEKLMKSILQMNHATMAEIRSYKHPPEGIHEIMMSVLLLLRKHEGLTKDWKQCQALCTIRVLSKEVAGFNVKELHPEIAARAKVLLQAYRIEDIALKSAGAAAFYQWVVGMTEELDQLTGGGVKKAPPALIKRQKEIFNIYNTEL